MIYSISGGARSGKSKFAEALALQLSEKYQTEVIYIATCEFVDEEMADRVKRHVEQRPSDWKTIEEPIKLENMIASFKSENIILIDCLTLWISNLLVRNHTEEEIIERLHALCQYMKTTSHQCIFVTNEVGLGIIPSNELSRKFRDIAGLSNQILNYYADEKIFVLSGIPIDLKKISWEGV
ncbi:bifunctional adenosylcobinamide kinase/adenosylcobinamide-phosphate guanylyltransferase [Desulfuribacillus stibiiarsenatis]|uniref:Adenosylcobinamide kinase n=1 Tax=Desulfuribacillus stibiiarsenatis TaxID=1390249 RepID=A0A1E5L415_9FIRM|nr:bifunctional adenosylcobinamide kinase/adenosylcobinamide-phosphate guanylyltransferase [Desulfuribacillus stibiiarsenatis]OEH84763.1 bifunctional adenosylcobinamide kinase/adenosylcobinamide-phosphate guanylyltransferase [Desulfuribacillus stibiiarsenatis]